MPIITNCPVCRSANTKLHLDGNDNLSPQSVGSSRTKLSHGRILRCNECRSCFRSFRPDGEQLAELYQSADDTVYEGELLNRRRTAMRHRRIVERRHPQPGTIIDVGCASGVFLRLMADDGWTVYGVEPAAAQYAKAKSILPETACIQQTTLEKAVLPHNADVVTLWDVLEHVPNPSEFLQKCSSLLRPSGHLVLNVPRIDSFSARLLRSHWPLLLAEHLNYFTLEGLRALGKQAGLQLVATGRRPVTFSVDYICYRLSQHGLPGMSRAGELLSRLNMQSWSASIFMGEIFAIFTKTDPEFAACPLTST